VRGKDDLWTYKDRKCSARLPRQYRIRVLEKQINNKLLETAFPPLLYLSLLFRRPTFLNVRLPSTRSLAQPRNIIPQHKMDRSLGMEEASASSQVNDHVAEAAAYAAGQKKKIIRINQQQHQQHEGASPHQHQQQSQLSSSPEREHYLERMDSNEGSGFLGTMR
jgi:hypothetical protein